MGYVYFLRFSGKLGNDKHQASTYIGYTQFLKLRVAHHRNGTGAFITKAAVKSGMTIELVGYVQGTRADERRFKNWKNFDKVVASLRSRGLLLKPRGWR